MQTKIIYTQNLKLATTLATFGVPFREDEPLRIIEDADNGNKKTVFFFFDDTPDGLGQKIMNKWEGGWEAITNYDDPLAYCRAILENRERLLDAMNKSTPLIKKQFGKTFLLISKNATPELRKKLAKYI
jgi:hypothetical protein